MAETDGQKASKKRKGNRGQMNKQIHKAEELMQKDEFLTSDKDVMTATIQDIRQRLKTIQECDDKILDEAENDEVYAKIFEEADNYGIKINETLVHFQSFLERNTEQRPVTETPTSPDTSMTSRTTRTVNLPKLQLPTFEGNILKWTTFIDAFRSSVDNDSSLENIQKFQYLMTQLSGKAARTVKGLQLTNANYSEALTLLEQRYGQPHKIISSYMKALWELQPPDNSLSSMTNFYDNLETYIRGLRSLGKKEDYYGDLHVPIIFEKLPANTRTQISREHGNNAWSITELKKAIHKEIQARQAGNPIEQFNEQHATERYSPSTTSFHVGYKSNRSSDFKPRPIKCAYCKAAHSAHACEIIIGPDKRMAIVKRDRLCFNCLGHHKVHECKSKYRCKFCHGKHHSTLCNNAKKTPVKSQTSGIEDTRQTDTNYQSSIT
uniref:Uncharacterized protein LOC102803186 n=1 Tax=Saccoglossus kowalevskii TaxID=10224 RepID=A0ABM0M8I4_SACKO|nr:PREDICTED: uncharacterized protein LOC102803186 [Saccoglossus kowalevskii]